MGEVVNVSGEACRDGRGVGDQEMEDVSSEESIFTTKVQGHILCTVLNKMVRGMYRTSCKKTESAVYIVLTVYIYMNSQSLHVAYIHVHIPYMHT